MDVRNIYPQFFRIAKNLTTHLVDFNSTTSDEPWAQGERPEGKRRWMEPRYTR